MKGIQIQKSVLRREGIKCTLGQVKPSTLPVPLIICVSIWNLYTHCGPLFPVLSLLQLFIDRPTDIPYADSAYPIFLN